MSYLTDVKSRHKDLHHSNVKRYELAPKRHVDIKGSNRLQNLLKSYSYPVERKSGSGDRQSTVDFFVNDIQAISTQTENFEFTKLFLTKIIMKRLIFLLSTIILFSLY